MELRYLLSAMLLIGPWAMAEEVVFYRCTDAGGALTIQNMPCPKGSRQQTRVMQGVASAAPTAVAPTRPPAPATPPPAAALVAAPASPGVDAVVDTATGADVAAPLPPPPLYRCTTHDDNHYFTESAAPQSRCVALRTVGLDGNPSTGAGEACEVLQDQCAAVPEATLCEAWKQRRDAAEVAWRFSRPQTEAKHQGEFQRLQQLVAESNCGAP